MVVEFIFYYLVTNYNEYSFESLHLDPMNMMITSIWPLGPWMVVSYFGMLVSPLVEARVRLKDGGDVIPTSTQKCGLF